MKQVEQPRPVTLRTCVLARLAVWAVRFIYRTLRLTIRREAECDALMRQHDGAIFVTWHGRTMVPIAHFRGRGYHTLVSLSRDGDFLAEYFRRAGLRVIRGSTSRRGVAATREVLAVLKAGGVLAFTPDGPRGPAGVAQPGVAYFAQRSGKPIIPAGISAAPGWRLGSWDRFLVPRPFARAVWIYGEPIFVGPGEDLEAATARVGEAIRSLQAEADAAVGRAEEATGAGRGGRAGRPQSPAGARPSAE